jgi:hypothetical protein
VDLDLPRLGGDRGASLGSSAAPTTVRWTTLSWVGVGVAGALTIASGVTGILALKASSDVDNVKYVGTSPSSDADSKSSRVKTLAIATDVFAGLAVVALAGTLFYTYSTTRAERPSAARVSVGVGPTGAVVYGDF